MTTEIRATLIVLLSSMLLLACNGEKSPDADQHGASESAEHQNETATGTLKIEASMLRDLRITTRPAESRTAAEVTRVAGELSVNEDRYAEVGPPIDARVVELRAQPGRQVRAGDVLAILQSPELGRARAERDTAASQVELATTSLERKRSLGEGRIVPKREIQDAEADLVAAEANLRAASAALSALGASAHTSGDPSQFPLTSPLSGVVIERSVVRGQVVTNQSTAFRVGDLTTLWMIAHAFERDAVRVEHGARVSVELAAFPGQTFDGIVALVGRHVETESRTVPVRIEIANPDGTLRPGMSGSALLPVSDDGGTIVSLPVAAVQRLDDAWVVFLPKDEGEFEVRKVGRGRDLSGEVEIITGLKAGETVVVDGAFLLKAEAEKATGGGDEHGH
ncbi:MAG: efflux RND transporter periplasmic adaptor subunit [Thermoanaerobaculia bacterium]